MEYYIHMPAIKRATIRGMMMSTLQLLNSNEAKNFYQAKQERYGKGRAIKETAKKYGSSVNAAKNAAWYW